MLIKDEILRQVVARTLRIKEEVLTPEAMLELTHLDAPDYEIKTLEGLETAENLEVLNVSNNQLETLEPIRDLRNLEVLDVSGNQLRDLQALHGHRQLKKLNLSRNKLYTMDISSVAAMIDLEYLNLERAKVDSLEYLERCKKLKEVYINTENGPFSFAILGSLKQLKKLHMAGMRLFNIQDLSYLENLEELDLSTNLMSDISPLMLMTNLKRLNLSNCPYIHNYDVLKDFPNLRSINLAYNQADDFHFLKDLEFCESLHLQQTGFTDLTLLNKMKNLKRLNVSKNEIKNMNLFYAI